MGITALRALIIDDEPLAHDIILNYAQDIPQLEIVGQALSATEALALLADQSPDLIFLDVQMPRLTGIELLKVINRKPYVIITSAYQEYALQGYEMDVTDYLLKPFSFDRFLKALLKVSEQKSMREQAGRSTQPEGDLPPAPAEDESEVFIKSGKRQIRLEPGDIQYVESYGNYIKVWVGDNCHLANGPMNAFEELLPARRFMRVHKSFLVNKQHIQYMEGNMLRMRNENEIPVGRAYREEVKHYIDPL